VSSLQTKCVMEEINRNVLVVGDFAAFHKDNSANLVPMTVKVHEMPVIHHCVSSQALCRFESYQPCIAGGGSSRHRAV
jgi:hypothetical protein